MSVRICQHVKVDGTLCQVPPLNGRHYCHFHLESLGRRVRMARARARREPYHLVLPILEDLNAVQVARQQVMDALTSGQLDAKSAGVLLYGLAGVASDLRSAAPPRLGVYDPAIDTAPRATEATGFEAKHGLPPDIDLSQPPEVLFPAAAAKDATAAATDGPEPSPYRSNPWQQVNKEDVELEEILFTQGQQAHDQRSLELLRKERKRMEQEERRLAQAHQIVEAARRNGRPWTSSGQKSFYEKCAAENAAREKAQQEDLAALRAAAQAQAAASKSRASAPVDEDAPTAAGEAGKKPSATVSGEEAPPATGQAEKSGT
jgi:hypothetical protein